MIINIIHHIIHFYITVVPYLLSGAVVYLYYAYQDMKAEEALMEAEEAWVRQFGGTLEDARDHIVIDPYT